MRKTFFGSCKKKKKKARVHSSFLSFFLHPSSLSLSSAVFPPFLFASGSNSTQTRTTMQSLAAAPSARLAGARASPAQQQQARPAVVAARASSKRGNDSAPTVAVAPALAAFAAAAVLVRLT